MCRVKGCAIGPRMDSVLARLPFDAVRGLSAWLLVVLAASLAFPTHAATHAVQLSPDAMGRALSEHQQLMADQQVMASSTAKPSVAPFVATILLPPDTRLLAVHGEVEARVLGTGWLHGYSLGHVEMTRAMAEAWQRGATLQVQTEAVTHRIARPRRAMPENELRMRRQVQERIVNPAALSRYLPHTVVTKATGGSAFAPTQQPSLDGSPVEMLILTREELRASFELYAHERTRFGTPTVVRTVEWVRQNYPQGADVQEMLRGFVREAYELWGIRYLLIGGDSGVIPARFAHSTGSGGDPLVPTDLYFSCLDGNWNQDGDAFWGEGYQASTGESDMADLYPEVFVGRVPVKTPAEVDQYLTKLRYYLDPDRTDFQGRMLFMSEVIWPANYSPNESIFKNGADNAERIIALNDLDQSSLQITRLYETPELYPGSDQLTRIRAQMEMDGGFGLVTHVGHGFRYTMSLGDASLTNVQANLLQNSERPFFLNMLNCTATAFDFPCLAERFVLNANGGAVGVIGASREASPDNVQLYQESWFATLFRDSQLSAAEALREARLRYLSQTFGEGAFRWTNFILSYLGDPKIDVWRGAPQAITVTHPATLPLGEQQVTVQVQSGAGPVANAVVCLWKQGDFYAVDQTNAAGEVYLDVRPETLGDLEITVCGAGVEPYDSIIGVTGVAGASLRATGFVVVDDAGPGTLGNGNGVLEAGETAFVQVELSNEGGTNAMLTTLLWQAADPFLVVPEPQVDVGTIASGATVLSPPVEVRLHQATLDQHRVDVSLLIEAQGWNWNDQIQLDLLQVEPQLVGITTNFTGQAPAAGEIYDLDIEIKNYGFGQLDGASANLYSADPDVNIVDGADVLGDITHLQSATAHFRVREYNTVAENEMVVVVMAQNGRIWSFPIETRLPSAPSNLQVDPSQGPDVVALQWDPSPSADVAGYRVYRAPQSGGPWQLVSGDWVTSTTSFRDDGLQGNTQYYYHVVAMDGSGNQSVPTEARGTTTNPTQNAGWPRLMAQWSNSPPLAVDLDGDFVPEVLTGSDRLYAWSADGTEVVDGDNNPATDGVWNTEGFSYVAGLAAADLDGDGLPEVVACSWDTREVYVFNGDGTVMPGWPQGMAVETHGIWATPAIGDLDLDGQLDIVMQGLDSRVYAWRADGSEVVDGDNNPATHGVFWKVPSGGAWSRGAPAIADVVPGDAYPEVILGTSSGQIYVLSHDGSVETGWPRNVGGDVNSAPSIGDIDGNGSLDIAVPATNGWLYCINGDGSDLAGWPVPFDTQWIALTPAVALHDFNQSGTLELVVGGSNGATHEGSLYMFDASGNVVPGWPVDVHSASEASPIIGDINGDAIPEIIYGGESGTLHGFQPDGTRAPGFPIQLGAEVRATPTLTDVDWDGDVDLLFAGWDQQVYVYDFPGPYVRSNIPWGSFKNNNRRNSVYEWRLPTDVGEQPDLEAVPAVTRLLPNVPNPFNPHTTIAYEIAGSQPQSVRLFIYDAGGRLVRRLVEGSVTPGLHRQIWNGTDDAGRKVGSGVYFYRLVTPDVRSSRKMILLR